MPAPVQTSSARRPICVLHLLDSLRVGGKERQAVELLKGLRAKGVENVVVTMGTEQFYVPDVEALGVPLVYLLRKTRWDPSIFPRLAGLLRRFRPQILHTNSSMGMFYAMPAARMMGVKLVNGTIRNAFSETGFRWKCHKALLRLADARVGNSKAGFASRGWRHDAPGNHVVYNGFDMERFETRAAAGADGLGFDLGGRKVAGMVAEFNDYKDFPTFIRAAQMVLSKRKDVIFVAVGGGKNLADCQQLAANEPNIRFLGPRKDVEKLVKQMDMGLLCTFTEGISNSVMEFMAAGKPVVVTDGGGSSELVTQGEDGFLVPPSNPAAVAEKIEWLLDNGSRASRMGEAAREKVRQRFSLEQLADNTLEIYRALAS
jgi:glycosyltransferase involved in cell wall biosynthesis